MKTLMDMKTVMDTNLPPVNRELVEWLEPRILKELEEADTERELWEAKARLALVDKLKAIQEKQWDTSPHQSSGLSSAPQGPQSSLTSQSPTSSPRPRLRRPRRRARTR